MQVTPDDDLEGSTRGEIILAAVRLVVGLVALIGVVALLGWAFRDELERFGRWFVDRFGLAGMAAGSFLADGLHFPLPPQFYLLTGVAGGAGAVAALASVIVGSVLGGLLAFTLARRVAVLPFLHGRLTATRLLLEKLVVRHGMRGLAIVGLLPLSYFGVCVLGGMLRLRYRAYGVLALTRIPRIIVSYFLIVLAWG